MRYVFAMWVIIVLVFLFFFAVFSLAESGASSMVLAVLSGFGIYRILKHMYKSYYSAESEEKRPVGNGKAGEHADPFEFIVFYDMASEEDSDSWDDY